MIAGLPFDQASGFADGAGYDEAIPVPGIVSGDDLMYVVGFSPTTGAFVASHDISDFTVATGSVTAASIDTTGQRLCVGWTRIP